MSNLHSWFPGRLSMLMVVLSLVAAACTASYGAQVTEVTGVNEQTPEGYLQARATPQASPSARAGSAVLSSEQAGGTGQAGQVQRESAAAAEVTVTAKEFGLQPATIAIPAGKVVRLTFRNEGAVEHDFEVQGLRADEVVVVERSANLSAAMSANLDQQTSAGQVYAAAAPGESTTIEFKVSAQGKYQAVCTVPGHKEAGMTADVSVGEGSQGASHQAHQGSAAMPHVSHASVVQAGKYGLQEIKPRIVRGVKVFNLTAEHVKWEVLPGEYIDAYAYNGMVPGPLIRVKEGDRVRINFKNELPEPTTIHFHGNTLPNSMDGVPDVTQPLVKPGETFTYEFKAEPAGTFIYHTHHNSAVQEPKGLYGVLIIEPRHKQQFYDQEVIQVLSEAEGYYLINGKAFPATTPIKAKRGERVLVRLINLGQMVHPMHMHGNPFEIVATDGHDVPPAARLTKDVVTIGPGERYDLLVKMDNPGKWMFHCHILSHVQNHGQEPGGMITLVNVSK